MAHFCTTTTTANHLLKWEGWPQWVLYLGGFKHRAKYIFSVDLERL